MRSTHSWREAQLNDFASSSSNVNVGGVNVGVGNVVSGWYARRMGGTDVFEGGGGGGGGGAGAVGDAGVAGASVSRCE